MKKKNHDGCVFFFFDDYDGCVITVDNTRSFFLKVEFMA